MKFAPTSKEEWYGFITLLVTVLAIVMGYFHQAEPPPIDTHEQEIVEQLKQIKEHFAEQEAKEDAKSPKPNHGRRFASNRSGRLSPFCENIYCRYQRSPATSSREPSGAITPLRGSGCRRPIRSIRSRGIPATSDIGWADPTVAALSPFAVDVLVGPERLRLYTAMRSAWDTALERRLFRIVVIRGPAGSGRTSMLQALYRHCAMTQSLPGIGPGSL